MLPGRIPLALLPTPLHRLPRLSQDLGVDLWIKRDDLTGFALGGNKARKLEYLLHAAVEARAEVVVTCGSSQSNFIRQLAAACTMQGIQCACAVMALPYEFEPPQFSTKLDEANGNVLLDELLGVHLEKLENGTWETLYGAAEDLAQRYERQGKRVFRIPIGGSSPLGVYAFIQAGAELAAQCEGEWPDYIVTSTSSGSTQTGLATFFAGTKTQIIGIAADPEPEIAEDFVDLSQQLAELSEGQYPALRREDFQIDFNFVGEGYGVPSKLGQDAIRLLAQTEGIFLDPIYSAKAFSGLLSLIEARTISGKVVFWHTGGIPALFALRSRCKD